MKNFVAADMRTALRMVREALGDEAVILASRRVPGGIELLASAEMPAPPPASVAQGPAAVVVPAAMAGADGAAADSAPGGEFEEPAREPRGASSHSDNAWWQMQQELRSMRDLMESQLSRLAWQQYRAQRPADAAMWRRLQRLGLDADIVNALLQSQNDDPRVKAGLVPARERWQRLMAALASRLPVLDDPVARSGIFAFVGPTGAGKTTTIGKLAARHVLAHGNADIALVTLDSFRIGAHEQLRTLGRILNVPVRVASRPAELGNVLYELRHCKLVLIDTAGLGTSSPALQEQLAALDGLGDRLQVLQVLAANSQRQSLQAASRSYRTANLAGCVVTKLDEAASLGEAISLAIVERMPLAYVANGQSIPHDLALADAKQLIAKMIALAKQIETDEMQLAAAFASAAAG
jgi:flagellar biosynthesis protein FlhF